MKKGFLNEGSKGGFQPPLLGGFQQPGLGDGGGGFYPDQSGQWLPTQLSGLVDWHRSDMGITLVGSRVSAWADQSGQGHNLTQGTDANRFDYTTNVIGGQPVLRPVQADCWMGWGGAASPEIMTFYAVIRMITATQHQLFGRFATGANGANAYLGSDLGAGAQNKPHWFTSGTRAVWTTALTTATNYLVKWAHDLSGGSPEDYFTQVGDDTEVSGSSAETIGAGTFISLGLDPGVSSTQDLVSDIAEIIIYNRRLSINEEVMVRSYVTNRYGIVM